MQAIFATLVRCGTCARPIEPETAPTGSPYMQTSIIYIAAANCDTIARIAASPVQSERENAARWLPWLRRLRTGNVERVEEVLFEACRWRPRITNMRQAREFGGAGWSWLKWNLSPAKCWSHQSVININMKALTLEKNLLLQLRAGVQAYRPSAPNRQE